MSEVLTQVAGMTREVAITYIIMYGTLEVLKLALTGVLGWKSIQVIGELFKGVFEI